MIDNGSDTAMLGLEGMAALAVSDGGGELECAIETTQTTECRGSRCSCPSDDTFLMLFNASWTRRSSRCRLQPRHHGDAGVLDTTQDTGSPASSSSTALPADSAYTLSPRSLLVLRRTE